LNVKINCVDFDSPKFVSEILAKGEVLVVKAKEKEMEILRITNEKI
jgi:hypothetical protein